MPSMTLDNINITTYHMSFSHYPYYAAVTSIRMEQKFSPQTHTARHVLFPETPAFHKHETEYYPNSGTKQPP